MEKIIENLNNFFRLNGWNDYKKMKIQLLSVNTRDLVIHVLNDSRFRNSDVEALLLCIPELWKDFSLNDWKFIIQKVNRSSNYRLLMDNDPCFEDVKFLYNWIEIDSINLYKNDTGISNKDKKFLNKVFPALLSDTLKKSGSYKEDFEDGTFCNPKYFQEAKIKLVAEGAKPL